ncbi:hypothetical protein F5Y10DRAFT_253766 [Nemania abortiva]|nr:hypothetical protein F5Y10DRAFT_253766 [Nemania abortiva]
MTSDGGADESGDDDLQWQPNPPRSDAKKKPEILPAEILADIRARDIDFSNPDSNEVQEFHKRYNETLSEQKDSKTVEGEGNILHILATESSKFGEAGDYWDERKLSQFLKWLLKRHWEFLGAKNKLGQYYPLHTAIKNGNQTFIRAILGLEDLPNIKTVLADQKCKDRGYVEVAVLSDSPMVEPIARRCAELSAQVWTSSGRKGETPLHVAIAKICHSKGQPNLTKALICHAEDTENPSPAAKRVYDKWKQRHTIKPFDNSEDSSVGAVKDTAKTVGEGAIDGYERNGNHTLGPVSRSDIVDLILEIICDYQHSQQPLSQVDTVKLFIELSDSFYALECRARRHQNEPGPGRTPYQARIDKLKEAWKNVIDVITRDKIVIRERSTERMTDEDALRMVMIRDPVADAIRYHCIRYYDRDRIARCLYQPGDERHIDFDLAGLRSPSVSRAFLNQLSRHLQFESILKYVALPKLGFNNYSSDIEDQHHDSRHSFRQELPDLRQVFQWLRENKVRRILKITVIDHGAPCHSDAAIEEALADFNVEIWDWKKIDICTDVIANSTKLVRHVSLYSSGNNAVLLGWASPDGLGDRKKFPKLENVRVFVAKGQEGDRRAEYIKAFEEKVSRMEISISRNEQKQGVHTPYSNDQVQDQGDMKNERRGHNEANESALKEEGAGDLRDGSKKTIMVEHHLDDGKVSYAADFKNDEIPEQQEIKWISKVKAFSTFMRNIPKFARVAIAPVKIAIIDDGVDASLDFLVGKIAGGKSFCPYESSSDLMNAYYVPSGQHGTMMADLICQICPECRLYVARLDEHARRIDSTRQIKIESAAKAIEWAIDCKVDIISMSWTIEVTGDRKEAEISRLSSVINKAKNDGIVMFCAASDQGSIASENCYPYKFEDCIAIGAATNTGDKCPWVPEQYAFLLPGKNIPFRWKLPDGTSSWYESGSSLATALATGLAGLLLYCQRVAGEEVPKTNASKGSMVALFKKLSQASGNSKFPRADIWLGIKFQQKLSSQTSPNASYERSNIGASETMEVPLTDLEWTKTTKIALQNLLKEMSQTY